MADRVRISKSLSQLWLGIDGAGEDLSAAATQRAVSVCRGGDRRTKVSRGPAEIQCMENNKQIAFGLGHYFCGEAEALSLSIAAIRKEIGKANPTDFVTKSPDWSRSME
jgi:hypothetical protein